METISGKPITVPAGARFEVAEYQELVRLAEERGVTLSDVLRGFVRDGLEKSNNERNAEASDAET